jgi:hypothetical protein
VQRQGQAADEPHVVGGLTEKLRLERRMIRNPLAPGEVRQAVQDVVDPAQRRKPGVGDGDDPDAQRLRARHAQTFAP